ncbi:MAG: tetratricopeptide repeat protein [Pseudomonadota bacterium]
MNRSLMTFTIASSSLLLTGCLMTRQQIREGANSGGGNAKVSQMQVKRAEEVARMDELEENLRLLRGEVEVAQNQLLQINAEKQAAAEAAASGDQPMSSKDVAQKLAIFEEALRALETRMNSMSQDIQQLKSRPAAAAATTKKPQESLGNYGGAEKAFDRKAWKQAIVGYEKYRELNPKGRRYADATYKIGVCFQELGLKTEAKSFYEEVIAKYPSSNTAKKAKYRLSQVR